MVRNIGILILVCFAFLVMGQSNRGVITQMGYDRNAVMYAGKANISVASTDSAGLKDSSTTSKHGFNADSTLFITYTTWYDIGNRASTGKGIIEIAVSAAIGADVGPDTVLCGVQAQFGSGVVGGTFLSSDSTIMVVRVDSVVSKQSYIKSNTDRRRIVLSDKSSNWSTVTPNDSLILANLIRLQFEWPTADCTASLASAVLAAGLNTEVTWVISAFDTIGTR